MEKKLTAFDRIRSKVKPENKIFVSKNLDIREQVKFILANHAAIKSQKDLAAALDKSESEVSKWISGLHNLTLESIAKLEAVLGQDIILTDLKAKAKYNVKSAKVYAVYSRVASVKQKAKLQHISMNLARNMKSAATIMHTSDRSKKWTLTEINH